MPCHVLVSACLVAGLALPSTAHLPIEAPIGARVGAALATSALAPQGAKPRGKAAPEPKPKPPDPRAKARAAEDARALAAFRALGPAEARDLLDYVALELEAQRLLQAALIANVLARQDVDRGTWPEEAPAPFFDPAEHAPAQPIPRRRLSATDPAAKELAARVLRKVPARTLRAAWRYDPGTRGIVRAADEADLERRLANLLAGYAPDADLAEALVERALDDGSQQRALAAFDHAYTDRDGRVYPGVTLYDAWASGAEIEMPDVDSLGIVHTVLGDRKTWVAPVDASQHAALYARIGELFAAAHRHRGLRRALAQCFLAGSAPLRDNYDLQLDNLHALWAEHGSDPAKLAEKLPDDRRWEDFLAAWTRRCARERKLREAGVERRARLDHGAGAVRATALAALEEFGAYERERKPAGRR